MHSSRINRRSQIVYSFLLIGFLMSACQSREQKTQEETIRLVTLDPGHFHAALVQKKMYDGVDSVVHVYAPEGNDLKLHLARIEGFNNRADNPTTWEEQVYTGNDAFEKMLSERAGNVVVLSGNNEKKTTYIAQSLRAGFHVLADKPMAINVEDFDTLTNAFKTAEKNNRLLYDIMTERFEITTILQREFSRSPDVFGELEKGSPNNPAIVKESVHHFYKNVSGSILTRPAWFMDVAQQGEGIVDVTTHLVDLVQWASFPDQVVSPQDISIHTAKRWATPMTRHQFKVITKQDDFPSYLQKDLTNDSTIGVYSNGEIGYTLKGIHAKVVVTWAYQSKDGTGDTHYSIMRGTKAHLVIRQGAEQKYRPTLYIEPISTNTGFEPALTAYIKALTSKYPGIAFKTSTHGYEVVIPDQYHEGHEAHFGRVMENFLSYLKQGSLPAWEVPNMITKYYTTTQALELARKNADNQ